MATPNSRRMRRSRDAATTENLLSGFDLYGVQGDAAAALEAFSESSTTAAGYNCALLEQIKQGGSAEDFEKGLKDLETSIASKKQEDFVSSRKVKRNEFILAYNRALILQTSGEVKKCVALISEKISDMIKAKEKPGDEVSVVASRMAFLLLECILSLAVGRNSGLELVAKNTHPDIPPVESIVEWVESLNTTKDPQLKFLLPVFKARIALAELEKSGKHIDNNVRAARKDMKTAMEVFQHKLRPSFGAETASVASSANSEENSAGNSTARLEQQQQPPPPSSVVLQKLNQSALCLKAHLEQLKGNTKKSLILCSEAQAATTSEEDSTAYEPLHSNNLAVVYETNNKRHLALHALAKSLRANGKNSETTSLFYSDGTARQDPSLSILHNTAICALRARNYLSAYECMAVCISSSSIFRNRPGCWLRLAEACVGIFTDLKRESNAAKFSTVEVDGEPQGIVVDNALFNDDGGVVREELETTLGSSEDMAQVKRNPLLRARASLEYAVEKGDELGPDALVSAQLSLAYVYLSFGEHRRALEVTKLVLDKADEVGAENTDVTRTVLHKRQIATARMYAAEASCKSGDMISSIKYLVGDGKDDAFDRLASDLGGVTLETASTNGKGKRRLAKAQAMVRSSACAVTATMGNPAAKQLANSATAMEDAYSEDRERSSARRALIYTLLREGHQSSALTMLLSLR